VLDELLQAVAAGDSQTLLVVGEAGVGKTALLAYLEGMAEHLDVVHALGVEADMELAFAGLHQLCAPLLGHLDALPEPQRDALEIVFGRAAGPRPDRFLIGLAVLSLLSEAAEARPLLCVIDDAQWLDAASGHVLAFVARRLIAEPIAMVFAARQVVPNLRGLPQMHVEGLRNGDARALLSSGLRFAVDERIRDRIVVETRGNPLALLELPQGLTAGQLADGFGAISAPELPSRIEESFLRRLETFPDETRMLLLVAAAEPVGDPLLLWRAVGSLGLSRSAIDVAEADGLLVVGQRVTFRHPLVRSAVYRAAPAERRRAAHLALADVTDRTTDPDRRAWHLASAASGPDEEVAIELERSADRAQARGGLSAAAAFLRRAVALSADPRRRGDRALAAADLSLQAGSIDEALGLLRTAEVGALDALQRARLGVIRAMAVYAQGRGSDAPSLLLRAAEALEPFDLQAARETYLDAWSAALFAGHLGDGDDLQSVSRAALAAMPPPQPPRPADRLLNAVSEALVHGRAASASAVQETVAAFASEAEVGAADVLRWGWQACAAAVLVWDMEACEVIATRTVTTARRLGALAVLSVAANVAGQAAALCGDFAQAGLYIAEADAVTVTMDTAIAPYAALVRAGLRGREQEDLDVITATIADASAVGQGYAVEYAQLGAARLFNGHGRYEEAVDMARRAADATPELFVSHWALAELVEAASRTGDRATAEAALARLEEAVAPFTTDWALGTLACARALLADGDEAEAHHREAIDRTARTPVRPDAARTHLLYGEWLRRQGRRVDARRALHTAHELCVAIGMEAFAERADRELHATGESYGRRAPHARDDLTSQELQIAGLARDGLSNREIGARLFLSPRTVEWHLRKVFVKLGITSRRELRSVLPRLATAGGDNAVS
jgi:DNA-binding CsgD family transcriptional regulator